MSNYPQSKNCSFRARLCYTMPTGFSIPAPNLSSTRRQATSHPPLTITGFPFACKRPLHIDFRIVCTVTGMSLNRLIHLIYEITLHHNSIGVLRRQGLWMSFTINASKNPRKISYAKQWGWHTLVRRMVIVTGLKPLV